MILADKQYSLEYLEESNSRDMNVDGSVTNKIFKWNPPSGEDWELYGLFCFLLDPGVMAHDSFGSISKLTNGIDIILKVKSAEQRMDCIMDNVELMIGFSREVEMGESGTGFLDDEDFFKGAYLFPERVVLKDSSNDLIKAKVRDDLTAIQRLHMWALVGKVL